ncbi:dihydrolipoamide acetyltransferase family protein [Leifsonia naganoensis]|uniref:Dihydrolipoamide acetyltransferase component of pyruvate dehydrogenase complex n=1 Tax=Leifsonia naganoensis TaxID=150025 RepID=A0A853DNW9_9MICO|nr:dihydrolipoamide acetyltransferase family protein [Leifsonia naganoensis]NYK08234.1 pyruvate dehydrogenase E2 component (dihydrolipoamide acetyltransferase) [Leifsonia naganoensis]
MAVKDFALPDLGEGLTESELVSWKVAVGDSVHLNQIIAEVETAKALVELPAPYDGRVSRLYVEPGVTVAVGEPLVAFEVAGAELEPPGAADEADDRADAPEPTLVGYGARPDATTRPARRARPGLAPAEPTREAAPARKTAVASAPAAAPAATATALAERPRATPPVRKLARERGIDLSAVTGTGARGLITRQDLDAAATGGPATADGSHRLPVSATTTAAAAPGRGDVRIPIRGVRKATAEAMVRSAFSAPQATVFLTVDVTATSELVERLRARTADGEARPGLLTVVAKALCLAIRRTPEVNARWDDDAHEIVQSGAVHLGIAAATPRGLLVPVVRDADLLPLADLAGAIRTLAETARSGRTAPADLSGSTITITNVGVFGVDAGTPIVTPGEAAILALGAVRRQPWEHDGGIALRNVLTLALSFDHRIVDGQQASVLLADLGRILSDPASVLAFV